MTGGLYFSSQSKALSKKLFLIVRSNLLAVHPENARAPPPSSLGVIIHLLTVQGGGKGGRLQGLHPPPPEMTNVVKDEVK